MCKNTRKSFNVKTGTAFANTKLPLRKWFIATYLFTSHKKGISSCQLKKYLGITQKSAYYLLDDLRNNIKQTNFIKDMLKGFIEIDETFIGGKNKNRHKDKKAPCCQGRNWKDKTPVLGMIERGGNLICKVVPNTKKETLEPIIIKHVEKGSNVNTDEWLAYNNLGKWFIHKIVNHKIKQYVNGEATTNAIEGFWSQFKKGINGTYHWISKKHTQKYIDEFVLRFNTRKQSEQDRFNLVISSMMDKQLTSPF